MAIDQQPPSHQPAPWTGHPSGSYPIPDPYAPGAYAPSSYGPAPYAHPYAAPGPYGGVDPYATGGPYATPYPGPYAAPMVPAAYVVPTSGTAVASLICSLLGLVTFGVLAIAGVICGHIALPETRSGARGGHGLAIAGLIIGWLQCGAWILVLLFWLVMGIGLAASV